MIFRKPLRFLLLLAAACFSACGDHHGNKPPVIAVDTTIKTTDTPHTNATGQPEEAVKPFDTLMTLFADTAYKVAVHIEYVAPDDKYDDNKMNASLTVYKSSSAGNTVLQRDSLRCVQHWLRFEDYNTDGVKDLLVFNTESARSNETYYLYCIDKQAGKLVRIKGFEKIINPSIDDQNIIESLNLAGTNYYSFYNITAENKLINLGHGFEADLNDTVKFDKAMKQILKEKKGTVKGN